MRYLERTAVRDVMHRGVITCTPEMALKEVARIMNATDVHAIVVVNDRDEVQGILSHMDILRVFGQDLHALTAGDVMTEAVLSVAPEAPLSEAVRLMLECRVHRLLVAQEQEEVKIPIGILSTTDVIDAMWGRPWLWERPEETAVTKTE